MRGGAVDAACRLVREQSVRARSAHATASTRCSWRSTAPTSSTRSGRSRVPVADADAGSTSTRRSSTATRRPRTSTRTARATATSAFAFVAHRAVVDVDPELGLVKVVQVATAQDVGTRAQPAVDARARSKAASPRASAWR